MILFTQDVLKNVLHTTLSHSFLVLSVSMICDPMIRGDAWLLATWKFWSKYGFFGFYNGLRARTLFNLIPLPLSPYLLFGIPDIISYRQMIDHVSFYTFNYFLLFKSILLFLESGSRECI